MSSPYRTIIEKMFRIVDRRGTAVDFILNPQQAALDDGWSRRNLITKIRQHNGISSYVIGRYVAKCLAEENRRCVLLSAEADATARLLARARYILENLKGDIKPVLGTDNQRAITFKKTGSWFWIGTAGSRVFGRGDTITDLHMSEAAYYVDARGLAAGLLPAAELGEVTVESTGNGVGNWFHRQALLAQAGTGFKLFFFGWRDVGSCTIPFSSVEERAAFLASLQPDIEEPQLFALGISPEQLRWRRERLVEYEYDLRKFKQEFPLTFDECFQSTGYSFFNRVRYEPTSKWEREDAHLHVLGGHPAPGLSYTIGADPSGGVGKDNACAQVFCLETCEQVAEYASPWCEPHDFGAQLAILGARFNNAYVNVERNNHGGTTLAKLIDLYPLELIHRGSHGEQSTQEILSRLSHYGTQITPANRGLVIGTTRSLLQSTFTIHSPALKGELDTFVEKEGKIEADDGCLDDRVFGCCHALIVVERAGIAAMAHHTAQADREPNPFSFEGLFGKHGTDQYVRKSDDFFPTVYH